jgi:hypothetical protein
MLQMTSLILACCAITTLTVSPAHAQSGAPPGERYASQKYGFSISVPARWFLNQTRSTPLFYSFDPSKTPMRQLDLPGGGAIISVVAAEELGGHPVRKMPSLSAWAAADAHDLTSADPNPAISTIVVPSESGIGRAIMMAYDIRAFAVDEQHQRSVNIYWEFKRGLFAAYLSYVVGDPKAAVYERVLLDTIRSVRPIRRTGTP